MSTVVCRTIGCANCNIPIDVGDDGTPVICGGGCNNQLRDADPSNPNFPLVAPKPSVEAVVAAAVAAEVARVLGEQQ